MSIRKRRGDKMYPTLFRNVIFPVMEFSQGTKIQKYLKWLEKTQWWKPEELEELQNKKLRALIRHAYENVPYYHNLFRKLNLKPEDIKTKEDLKKLPILTKDEIRKNFIELLAKNFEKWKPLQNATSGTTGEPLKYYITIDSASIRWASGFRAWGWAGYKLGDKRATLAGASLVPSNIPFKKRLRYLFERNLPLSAFNLTEEAMAQYAQKLRHFKPKFIRGYPTALSIFAKYLDENNIYDLRPQAIFTTAETLFPHQRKIIENAFGCEVFDGYGCVDGNANAMECNEHIYHIASEQVVMEFVKKGERVYHNELGEVVVTDLYNYAMPFIRYAPGDVAIPSDEQCPCGRGLPLIKSIEGRTWDLIITRSGRIIYPILIPYMFYPNPNNPKEIKGIKQYQVVQETKEKLLIKIVKESGCEEDFGYILQNFRKFIGDEMDLEVSFVESIPPEKSGKVRLVVSKVKHNKIY